jgi:outer membrane protein OmpA-like peptidoglycan-associated protein
MIRAALVALLAGGAPAWAELAMPTGAERTLAHSLDGAATLAAGTARGGVVHAVEYAGAVSRTAWKVPGQTSTFALMDGLRKQLVEDGWRVTVSCEARQCGGFDFRFAIEVLPEPAMHVDLGDFRYLLAERLTDSGVAATGVLVSRSDTAGYIQVIAVAPGAAAAPGDEAPVPAEGPAVAAPPEDRSGLAGRLEREGRLVLDDLAFATGSSTLGDGEFASLRALAVYLKANPDRRVAIVGHTDSVGSAEANAALSRRRAVSVVERLVNALGVAPSQVMADGVGFLAPRASNLTEEGRNANRRVEAVLISTE